VGLDAYDGFVAHGRIQVMRNDRSGTCRSRRQMVIEGGQFAAQLPGLRTAGAYPPIGVYVDLNGDGRCTPGHEAIWGLISYAAELQFGPEELAFDGQHGACEGFSAP
jgi:hypothetical protein